MLVSTWCDWYIPREIVKFFFFAKFSNLIFILWKYLKFEVSYKNIIAAFLYFVFWVYIIYILLGSRMSIKSLRFDLPSKLKTRYTINLDLYQLIERLGTVDNVNIV